MASTADSRDFRFADAQDQWRREEWSQARASFEALARDFPDDDEVRFGLAVIYFHLGDYGRAGPLFATYLRRHPDNQAAGKYLAWSQQAAAAAAPPAGRPGNADATGNGPAAAAAAPPRNDEVPLPYESTLRERVVVGRVKELQVRQDVDQNRVLTAYSANINKQNLSILAIRLARLDGHPPVAVELRGRMIGGSLPREGDRIAVPERWKDGALRVSRLQNLETGEIVAAREPSVLAKSLFGATLVAQVIFGVIVIAFMIIVFAQLLPHLLNGL